MVEHAREEGIPVPPEMVGDLAFIPLDASGRAASPKKFAPKVQRDLQAQPDLYEIQRIARQKHVLVILSASPGKVAIARAIFGGCVLGASLAEKILAKPPAQDAAAVTPSARRLQTTLFREHGCSL